ncbi:hypothetical protein LX87_03099 [Larkinella arboricola]|uniref:Uncharacterized protein n=1 Tax=Larkinella arboricola TaxID=643671 RepID=A0A327X029_LARAB|nr:hypothetical protein LX87_03099 [Larkinella arboricola]
MINAKVPTGVCFYIYHLSFSKHPSINALTGAARKLIYHFIGVNLQHIRQHK